jgi:ATP-dependent Clp protease protease subunit
LPIIGKTRFKGEGFMAYIIEQGQNGQEKVYDVFSRMLKDRIIFITNSIDMDMANEVVAQLLFLESDSPEKDICIYINTPGGRIDAMYAIYDTMMYIKPEIITVGFGEVMSAGTFLIAAGTKGRRYALPNTQFMIHEMSSGTEGKAHEMFNYVKHMEFLYEKFSKHMAQFTGQKEKKVKEDMKIDYYMSAEEAKNYGLIDAVQLKRE